MARKTKAETEQTRRLIIDAARSVFAERGVSHTSLEQIAEAAGVSRGAIYWHFANKAEIFLALRDDIAMPIIERFDAQLRDSSGSKDPLVVIEEFLRMHIDLLKTDPAIRQTFEVMFFKCEYTGEFGATLQQIVCKTHQIEERLLEAYTAAAEKGLLRAGLKPASLARDTYAFLLGVVRLCVGSDENNPLSQSIPGMLGEHIALRRR